MAIEPGDAMSLTTSPTSWLESLSTEILQAICAQFCRHCQGKTLIPHFDLPLTEQTAPDRETISANAEALQDLFALSLVSRWFRQVAQPILYYEFPSLKIRQWRLEPFLHTVIARPDLAKEVKTLAFHSNLGFCLNLDLTRSIYRQGLQVMGTNVNQVWSSRCEDRLEPKQHKALQTFLFGSENTPYWEFHFMSACVEILVLLLSLSPNVTTLIIDGLFTGISLPPSAFRVFGISSIKLRCLYATRLPHEIVDVAHDLDEVTIGSRFQVQQEPRPKSISYCLSPEDVSENNPVPHRLEARDIEKTFAYYKKPLQSFRYEMRGINYNTELPRPSFSFLNSFRTTLQSLHLDFRVHIAHGATIGSLKKFTNLKDLFITTNLIYHSSSD
ncbi:hypothetical protein FACUT_2928 [Fusarium acutatum]|uniref:Uncharacterized protein n=1 Tax=Fusarium acutatum TaxID=78861 RepID=A0A8H4JY58_9HYPO|nr:hypothetical protein FACUT_2928 [Fusarium acutatum]